MEEMLFWHYRGITGGGNISELADKEATKLSIIHHLAQAVPVAQPGASTFLLETSSP